MTTILPDTSEHTPHTSLLFPDFAGGFYNKSLFQDRPSLPAIANSSTLPPYLTTSSSLYLRIRHLTLRTALLRTTILVPHHPLTVHNSPLPSLPVDQCSRIIATLNTTALPLARDFGDFTLQSRAWFHLGRAEIGLGNWDAAAVAFGQVIKLSVGDADEQRDLRDWEQMARAVAEGWESHRDAGPTLGQEIEELAELREEKVEGQEEVEVEVAWRVPRELRRSAFTAEEKAYIESVPWGARLARRRLEEQFGGYWGGTDGHRDGNEGAKW